MKKSLADLNISEIQTLSSLGVLNELYPEAADQADDIYRRDKLKKIFDLILASYDSYDIINIQLLVKNYIDKYES